MEKSKQVGGSPLADGLFVLAGLGLTGLLTAAQFPFGLSPAGLAFAGAWGLAGLPGSLLLLVTALCLRVGSLPMAEAVLLSGIASVPVLLGFYLKGRNYARDKWFFFLLLLSGGYVAFLGFRGGLGLALREAGEVVSTGLLAWQLAPVGQVFLRSQERATAISPQQERRMHRALVLLTFLIYLALDGIVLWTAGSWRYQLNYAFLFLVLMVVSQGREAGSPAAWGLLFLLVEFVFGEIKRWHFPWIGGSSLFLTILMPRKKGNVILVVLLPSIIGVLYGWQAPELWSELSQIGIALFVFLVLPMKSLLRWQQLLKGSKAGQARAGGVALLLAESATRLRGLAALFRELGRTFAPTAEEEDGFQSQEILSLFQEIADQNCLSCRNFNLCWKERFYQTYRELFTLVGWAELGVELTVNHLKGHLAKACQKKEALVASINLIMDQERTGHYWRRRFTETKQFLADRLTGIAGLLAQMAETSTVGQSYALESEEKLGKALRRRGISGAKVSILAGGENAETRLLVEKHACPGTQECRIVVRPLLAELLGHPLAVTNNQCKPDRDGCCLFALGPQTAYEVYEAVKQVPKKGNKVSGDSQLTRMIGDHLFLALLSDGMGVGEAAARISQATIKIIEQMCVAGFERNFALQNLNSLLLLATPEEEFATLDFLLFDKFSGEVELFKIGSAPTYVKKGRQVQVIRSTSLPIGIVSKVEPEYYHDYLDNGDLVVMVSDGAATLGTVREDWILKALKRIEESAAEPISQYLLELAKIEAGGEINDDLTIMVFQIAATSGGC